MKRKLNISKLNGGDCLILKANKQKFNIIFTNEKTVSLIVSQDVIYFPKNKLSRYFYLYRRAKKSNINKK